MLGQLLAGHYKVLQVLGAGGFGQTYIVEDIHLPGHPKCVLKHLRPTSTDPEVLTTAGRLFQKEAETLQQLGNHEQIPRLLAYFQEESEFYLVQEFISGHLLSREFIPGHKWSETQVIKMLLEVLRIVEFVHSHGVIHRDIKPDNIIRRRLDNKLVLIDFGSIKQLRNQTALAAGLKNRTIAIGTPGYMPSEQNRGMPRPNSDIFALGMMGIQALTGVPPQELQDDPNTGEIQWQNMADVSTELAAILTKMTQYHFKDRYETATEVLKVLRELANTVEPPKEKTGVPTVTVHEMTLEWVEEGEHKKQVVVENQASKNPGKVRIGRDAVVCDIVLADPTVSALHAEIFFNNEREKFYLRNLRHRNPPVVDGQLLLAGEIALSPGSSLRLGKQNIKVSSITLEDYPAGYNLVDYLPESKTIAQQPLAKTEKPPIKQPDPVPTSVSLLKMSGVWRSPIKIPLLIASGAGMAVLVTAIAGFTLFEGGKLGAKSTERNSIIELTEKCRIITPTAGKHSVRLRPEPQTEVGSIKQLQGGEKVVLIRAQGDFVQVKDAFGTQGWIFRDQIQPCEQPVKPAETRPSSSETSRSNSASGATSSNDDDGKLNKNYEEGFKQGTTYGLELGKKDGNIKGAKERNADKICGLKRENQIYDKGFKEGCQIAYKDGFAIARDLLMRQKPKPSPKPDSKPVKQDISQDTKNQCQVSPNTSTCQEAKKKKPSNQPVPNQPKPDN